MKTIKSILELLKYRMLLGFLTFAAIIFQVQAQTEEFILHSDEINQDFSIYLTLPENFSQDKAYPLVMFTDANQFYPTKNGDGQYNKMMVDISQILQASGTLPKVVLVGIGYPPPSYRSRDLTPGLGPYLDQNRGGADNFATFIEAQVKPFVYSKAQIDRTNEAYLGHSLGGLFGAYVLFNRPELFDNYVLSSPAFAYGFDGSPNRKRIIFEIEEQYNRENTDMVKSVYISAGSEEGGTMAWDAEEMYDILASRNYQNMRLNWALINGENHKSAVRPAYFDGLSFVFEGK